jgi:hypothetical protein
VRANLFGVDSRRHRAVRAFVRRSGDRRIELTVGSPLALRVLLGPAVHELRPAALRGVPGDVAFDLRDSRGRVRPWTVRLTPDGATARPGRGSSALLTVRCTTADLVRLSVGELHPGRALLTRRLDVGGDLSLAMTFVAMVARRR